MSRATLTMFFTDVEQSTRILSDLSTAEFADLVIAQRKVMRRCIDAHHGRFVSTTGDGMFAVFSTATDAVRAAIAAQLELQDQMSPTDEARQLRVRMGLHTGEVDVIDGDYFGMSVHLAARVADSAHGEQIIVSESTAGLLNDNERSETDQAIHRMPLGLHTFKGVPDPVHVYQISVDGMRRTFPPIRTESTVPGNLPQPLTSFVGREAEVDELASLIGHGEKLTTLTGPGGVGKTRLAVQVAAEIAATFDHGAWFVDLVDARSDDQVAPTAARALGIVGINRDPTELLDDRLAGRRSLIILDNCEHVLDGAARLAELLRTNESLQILATSRQALGLPGEIVRPLLGLTSSAGTEMPEAIALFVSRVADAAPHLTIESDELELVRQLAHRLDGIPLAIELAAPLLRSHSIETLIDRLDERSLTLSGHRSDHDARQENLRTVVDWSYQLLEPDEQATFRRLGVCAGAFPIEAATVVAGWGGVDPSTVLDVVDRLVAKSLLVSEREDGVPRFRMLETIRDHAIDVLESADESDRARDALLEYCVGLARRAIDRDLEPDGPALHDELDRELANIRASFDWACSSPRRTGSAMELLGGAGLFLWLRGYCQEGADMAERLFRLVSRDQPGADRALLAWGTFLVDLFEIEHASEVLRTGRRVASRSGDELLAGWCDIFLALTNGFRGDLEGARRYVERSLEIANRLATPGMRSGLLYFASTIARMGDDRVTAREYLSEATELARLHHSPYVLVRALPVEGHRRLRTGDIAAASELHHEALAVAEEIHDRVGVARALLALGSLSMSIGDFPDASASMSKGLRIATVEVGDAALEARLRVGLSEVHSHLGDQESALDEALAAHEVASRLGRVGPLVATMLRLAQLAGDAGESGRWRSWTDRAHEAAESSGRTELAIRAALGHVEWAALTGDIPLGIAELQRTQSLLIGFDEPWAEADFVFSRGLITLREGDRGAAKALLGRAADHHSSLHAWMSTALDLELMAAVADGDEERADIRRAIAELRGDSGSTVPPRYASMLQHVGDVIAPPSAADETLDRAIRARSADGTRSAPA